MAKKPKFWAVMHWLGELQRVFTTEKEAKKWAKKGNFNPKHPNLMVMPITNGVSVGVCDKCHGKGRILTLSK